MSDLSVYDDRLSREMAADDFVLAVVTAAKPDFAKQTSIVTAARERDVPCFVLHAGQRHDELPGRGLAEYGIEDSVAVETGATGSACSEAAELMLNVEAFVERLAADYPDTTVLPVIHGDTVTASIVSRAWVLATNQGIAHNEAGLRAMSPSFERYPDPEGFVRSQWEGEWSLNRTEPFPEQYNALVCSAAAFYHFAPTELNRQHLIDEGHPAEVGGSERIPVVGNSVVDTVERKTNADLDESVFDVYPVLESRDDWIRVDVHHKANLLPDRFGAIVDCVLRLVDAGYNVNFVELPATRTALEEYGVRERFVRLDEERANFLFTGLWPEHAHVYEFLGSGQCFAALTDSGGMQDELSYIDETCCLTARYNTERPETVFDARTNLLVPPTSGDEMYEMIAHVHDSESIRQQLRDGSTIHGENVGDSIVEFFEERWGETPFEWAHDRLGFAAGGSQPPRPDFYDSR
jgi:UDP-N-acetylglucosamine 2-epimerase (non-hydrolysing)